MMKLTFEKLNDVSSWSGRTEEVRYCPLTQREYKVTERLWPSYYLDQHFKLYVN